MCEKYKVHCTADGVAGLPDSGLVPFSLPPAVELPLYDFYCELQLAGVEGFNLLALAGEGLHLRAERAAELAAPIPSAEDGSVYKLRSDFFALPNTVLQQEL